jgi:hypothetical protein
MKHAIAAILLALAVLPAQAQDDGQERARIASERSAAEARFAESERACRARFAVTDCVNRVRQERNAILGDLRRQEMVLNEAERRRAAAERQRELDERNSAANQRAAAERRERAMQDQKDRQARAAEKAAARAADQAERAANPPRRQRAHQGVVEPQGRVRGERETKAPAVTAAEAAENRRKHEERLREATQHKAEVLERAARRSKPAASGLPTPP